MWGVFLSVSYIECCLQLQKQYILHKPWIELEIFLYTTMYIEISSLYPYKDTLVLCIILGYTHIYTNIYT